MGERKWVKGGRCGLRGSPGGGQREVIVGVQARVKVTRVIAIPEYDKWPGIFNRTKYNDIKDKTTFINDKFFLIDNI